MASLPNVTKSILSVIRSNRRALRQRGLTAADLLVLEALAVKAPSGLARVSVAALGRMVGVHRSTALHHVKRLEAAGAVLRVGCAMMVNARGVLEWAADACVSRLEHVKRLFQKRKSRSVGPCPTHRRQKGLESEGVTGIVAPALDRHDARVALAAMGDVFSPQAIAARRARYAAGAA